MSDEEFCLIHGYSHMRRRSGEFIDTCEMCEAIGDAVDDRDKEISRLKEELKEAREIVSATADYLSDEWFPHISKKGNSRSRIKERARAFLDRGE